MFKLAEPLIPNVSHFEVFSSKEDLLKLLKAYRGILNKTMIDYLTSLINLEFSVVRDYISDTDRKALADLEVYKKIAIYNIFKRTQKLFKQNGEYIINGKYIGIEDNVEDLTISTEIGKENIKIFNFYRNPRYNAAPEKFKTLEVGTISLYQYLENKEARIRELEELKQKLEYLKKAKNPCTDNKKIGGRGTKRAFERDIKMSEYERKIKELSKRIELTDDQKRIIEASCKAHELILEEFGLKEEDFEEYKELKFSVLNEDKPNMSRTLVKKMPNLLIEDNITYL